MPTLPVAKRMTCPKCRGLNGLRKFTDTWGSYISCLYCGFARDYGAKPLAELMATPQGHHKRRRRGTKGKYG